MIVPNRAITASRRGATYLFDALGSVTGLTNSSGAVSERYDYEPYGTPAPRSAGQWGATTAAADVANGQFGFAAGYRSVGGLYHFGQRYYDPTDMRWTQPDPLDQSGDLRERNPYGYAGGDPGNLTDPLGLHVSHKDDHVVCDSQGCKHRNIDFNETISGRAAGDHENPTRVKLGAKCLVGLGAGVVGDAIDNPKNALKKPKLGPSGCILGMLGF